MGKTEPTESSENLINGKFASPVFLSAERLPYINVHA